MGRTFYQQIMGCCFHLYAHAKKECIAQQEGNFLKKKKISVAPLYSIFISTIGIFFKPCTYFDRAFKRINMGKVNVCLKRSYIIVTSLIAILSALLLAVTLFHHGRLHDNEEIETMLPGLYSTYGIAIITLILTIIGVYGACKEMKWALILFVVGMILGSLFLITSDILGLARRPQEAEQLKRHYLQLLPLNNASEITIDSLKNIQIELQCCGLDQGYQDWGYNIPQSCLCSQEATNPCVEAPRNNSLSEYMMNDQYVKIYKEPCLPYLISYVMMVIDTAMGILLGVALLWILSVVLCIFILCRLSKKEELPVVVYSTEAKAGNYAPLADTAELT
ncbi:tetraspanin-8-like [Cebidichthys violaceus]|uniref:tetraspanin-8-like n=1 Tax=Cebidichthys violaceus TaxID=271503 RepID=UPI0035C9AAC2